MTDVDLYELVWGLLALVTAFGMRVRARLQTHGGRWSGGEGD